ncbi:MAG: sigma-70 family RNA polymerase sigma factor [Planctomycetes bacterium]|nr:sigma-70 family RNA polymerase sigma factor [Planctomycetota bacterium]
MQAPDRFRYYHWAMKPAGTTRISFLHRLRDRADQQSWAEFHHRYGELLYRYAQGRGASHSEAEDVVQEVEMYVFKAMDRFRYDARKGRFRAYLRIEDVATTGRVSSSMPRGLPTSVRADSRCSDPRGL